MKKVLALISAAVLLVVLGCGTVGPIGGLFTNVKGPGQFEAGETTNMGANAISEEACAMSILGVVAIGDWSVDAALKKAGAEGKTLKNVAIDHRVFSILGFVFGQYCTRVSAQIAQ
jgi:hypothetical protein